MATDNRFYKEPNVKKLNAELNEKVSNPPKAMTDKYPELFNKGK